MEFGEAIQGWAAELAQTEAKSVETREKVSQAAGTKLLRLKHQSRTSWQGWVWNGLSPWTEAKVLCWSNLLRWRSWLNGNQCLSHFSVGDPLLSWFRVGLVGCDWPAPAPAISGLAYVFRVTIIFWQKYMIRSCLLVCWQMVVVYLYKQDTESVFFGT